MSGGELLLELLSEEIPARMQRRAIEDLTGLIRDKLSAAEIPAAELRGTVTPRRLTVIAGGIPERQPDRSEERRGPRVGAPPQALDGFLRAAGLSSIEQCEVRDTGRGEFYFAIVQHAGRPAAQVLPELVQAAIAELPWPKSMRFPAAPLRWVRPLTSVLCLFDGEVLPLSLGDVPVGRTTGGHRFLSPGEIAIDNAADYLEKLEAAHVILDQDRRRDIIAADLDRLAQKEGVKVKPDPGLLDEVTGLAEFPVVLIGAIDDESMALPPEVLATAMRTHQKYFTCLKSDGSPAPRFLVVANNLTPDDGKTIVAGNERVLRARLADARFFWDQDRKIRLADRVEALKDRVYHAALGEAGSMLHKARRMEKIAASLAPKLDASPELATKAAGLAKADLSTGMVGEFPELQGVMGRYYALHGHEDPRVADAIADHYKPQGPNDVCPTKPESVVVALADKVDALVAFFATDDKPTGSRDPYALRRAALGVIRLILENGLRIRLLEAFVAAADALYPEWRTSPELNAALADTPGTEWQQRLSYVPVEVLNFIADRLKVHLRERGVRYDLISAVFYNPIRRIEAHLGFGEREDDLLRLLACVDALSSFLDTDDGKNLLIAYRRASNIVEIEEDRDGKDYHQLPEAALFQQSEEKNVFDRLSEISSTLETLLQQEQFIDAMQRLATLRQPVDEFFEKVTVNTERRDLRSNRLKLLSYIRDTMNRVADFSQIEG